MVGPGSKLEAVEWQSGQGLGGKEPGVGLVWFLHAGGVAVVLEHGVDQWLSHKMSLLWGQAGGMKEERETGSRITRTDLWLL